MLRESKANKVSKIVKSVREKKVKDPSTTVPFRVELRENQKQIIQRLKDNELTVLIGNAGTAKDFMQLFRAVDGLVKKEFEKIIVCKPIVEIGRSMGFLPGDLNAKQEPYVKSFYDNLAKIVGKDRVAFIKPKIEFQAVNFLRGNTFDENSVIILSEAQNLTLHELMSFITRLPESSKLFINGDLDQSDIKDSGLYDFLEILKDDEEIEIIELGDSFQMRRKLITRLTKKYNEYKKNKCSRSIKSSKLLDV